MKRTLALATLLGLLGATPATAATGTEEALLRSASATGTEVQAEVGGKPQHQKVIIKGKKGRSSGRKVVVGRHGHGPAALHVGPPVVVEPVVVHRRAVIVHSPPPVVETVRVVPERRREVTHRQYARRPAEDSLLGIGVRLSGVTVGGEKLNLATIENPTMGGLGLQIRGKVSSHVGLELGTDILYGQTDYMKQTTVPLMLSAMYYLIPDGKFKLYGLLGGGVHFTKLEYDLGLRHDLVEVAGQAGAGIELRLSRQFGLNADLRFIGLYKNIDDSEQIQTKCLALSGMSGCQGVESTDKFNVGAQFMAGANLYF